MRAFLIGLTLVGCSAAGSNSGSTGVGGYLGASSSAGQSATGRASSVGSSGTSSGASTSTGLSTGGLGSTGTTGSTSSTSSTSAGGGSTGGAGCGPCPSGAVCGTANGLPVCRAASGIPVFSHVFVIMMENLSYATLLGDGGYPNTPYLGSLAQTAASSADYHGVAHPSLPNYLALTSGEDVSGIDCDCQPTGTACTQLTCNTGANVLGVSCGCPQTTANLGDDLEGAGLGWRNYGEDMGTPCNPTLAGNYAPKHVPFLYYPQIQTNAARCAAHVVDFTNFAADLSSSAMPAFAFVSPNLIDDMHNPTFPSNGPANQTNGDTWLAQQVPAILASSAYRNGGLLVVVWDEDDNSGGLLGSDDPVPFFLASPYAKHGGYVSTVKAGHYDLLATFEDGLGLRREGLASTATPLGDFFPAN